MGYEQWIGGNISCNATDLPSAGAAISRVRIELIVKELISERRRRSAFFPSDLFADPAWDLLLVLTLAQTRQHRLSVSKLCSRVDVPATTALRWITKLTQQGLLTRRDDVTDGRRRFIELSADTYATMVAYCSMSGAAVPLAA